MTKRERLEDLGRLREMLKVITDDEIFEHTDSKHGYEQWVKTNHDKMDYYEGIGGESRGLDHIFCCMRGLHARLQECLCVAIGDDD